MDVQVLSSHLRQRRNGVWDNLDKCPRTCPTGDLRLCSTKRRVLGLQVTMLGHIWTWPSSCAGRAALHALGGLQQAAQGQLMLASCVKTR